MGARGEASSSSSCGIHVSVSRTRKYTGKDTWSPVNRAQHGYPPRETARFTAHLRRDPTSSHTEIVSSFYNSARAGPSLTNVLQFPSGARQDFHESKNPFSSALSRLSATKERALREPSLISFFLRSHPTPFIYSVATEQIGRAVFGREFRIY